MSNDNSPAENLPKQKNGRISWFWFHFIRNRETILLLLALFTFFSTIVLFFLGYVFQKSLTARQEKFSLQLEDYKKSLESPNVRAWVVPSKAVNEVLLYFQNTGKQEAVVNSVRLSGKYCIAHTRKVNYDIPEPFTKK